MCVCVYLCAGGGCLFVLLSQGQADPTGGDEEEEEGKGFSFTQAWVGIPALLLIGRGTLS